MFTVDLDQEGPLDLFQKRGYVSATFADLDPAQCLEVELHRRRHLSEIDSTAGLSRLPERAGDTVQELGGSWPFRHVPSRHFEILRRSTDVRAV